MSSEKPNPPSDTEIESIRLRAETVTPGPWSLRLNEQVFTRLTPYTGAISIRGTPLNLRVCGLDTATWDDADFIAAARTDVPRLLAAVEWRDGLIADMQLDEGFRRGVEEGRRQCIKLLTDEAQRLQDERNRRYDAPYGGQDLWHRLNQTETLINLLNAAPA